MQDTTATWADLFSGRNRYKTITLALGVLLHVSNIYIATTVLPTVVKEIGGLEFYAWNTTVFVIASIMGSVFSASCLSGAGPLRAYRMALVLFIAGTAICIIAANMQVLLGGRFIQGLGGGLLFALSYAMIRIVFDERLWPRSMALVSGMWGIGAFVGPFVGGIFAEYGHWRIAFGCMVLVSLVLLLATERILPSASHPGKGRPVPVFKLLLLLLAALSVSVGSIYEHFTINIISMLLAVVFIAGVIRAERGTAKRLLPTGAYRLSGTLGTVYMVMLLFSVVAAVEIFVPYFAQAIYHYTPLKAGYLAVLVAFGWTLGSLICSGRSARYMGKLILCGALLLMLGLYTLTVLSHEGLSTAELLCLCAALLVTGAGIGIIWPHLMVKVFSLAPPGEEELASASVTTLQLVSMTFGAALGGLIANYGGMTHPGGVEGARHASLLLYVFFMSAPLLVIILLIFHKKFRRNLFGKK